MAKAAKGPSRPVPAAGTDVQLDRSEAVSPRTPARATPSGRNRSGAPTGDRDDEVTRERQANAVRRSAQDRERAARILADRRARAARLDRQGRRPEPGAPGPSRVDADRPGRPTVVADGRRAGGRSTAGTSSRERMLRKRRRSVVLLVLLLAVTLMGLDILDGPAAPAPPVARPSAALPAASAGVPTVIAPRRAAPTTPAARPARVSGPVYADGTGPLLGTAGTLRRYRVAVEEAAGQAVAGFAATVDRVLGDPRSWTASGQLRLQRVPKSVDAEFTVLLATAASSERICRAGGLRTEGYTSCRLPGQVVINLDRWLEAVPGYGAPLTTYQAYAINHEVGHQLGHGHEACPGGGRPAPVMQQQTYGLKGCTANPWPYLEGTRYSGAAVA